MRQLQHDAGKALVSLSLAQERIKRGGRNLTDQHPKDAWWQNLEDESDRTAFPREGWATSLREDRGRLL